MLLPLFRSTVESAHHTQATLTFDNKKVGHILKFL